MPRYFTNPFGWDWMPRGEDVYDISTGDMWNFGGGFNSFYDKYEEIKKTAKMWEEIKNVNIKLSFDEERLVSYFFFLINKLNIFGAIKVRA